MATVCDEIDGKGWNYFHFETYRPATAMGSQTMSGVKPGRIGQHPPAWFFQTQPFRKRTVTSMRRFAELCA